MLQDLPKTVGNRLYQRNRLPARAEPKVRDNRQSWDLIQRSIFSHFFQGLFLFYLHLEVITSTVLNEKFVVLGSLYNLHCCCVNSYILSLLGSRDGRFSEGAGRRTSLGQISINWWGKTLCNDVNRSGSHRTGLCNREDSQSGGTVFDCWGICRPDWDISFSSVPTGKCPATSFSVYRSSVIVPLVRTAF